jgi:peptide/nickel transport system substrate-binding protein
MAHGPRVTRRRVLRTGSVALATGVGAAALAACGETKVVTKEVPVEKTIVKEVPVEKIVKQTQIKEVPVEKIVTRNVIKTVEKIVQQRVVVEKIVEKMVEAVAERAPGIDIYNLDTSVAIDGKPWNPQKGGEVSYFTFGNPTGFDPATWGGRTAEPANAIFELLYNYGPGNAFYPGLASDMPEVSDDKLSWNVPLRKDVQFQDGEPFNADAVIFNFDRFLDEELPRGHVVRDISGISSVDKVDDYTVKFNTSQPQAFFVKMLGHQHAVFASPKAIKEKGEDFNRDPVGTGPWKLSKWEDDVKLIFDRNEDYNWGPSYLPNTGAPYPDNLRVQIFGYDMTVNAQAFEAGEVDILLNWSFADYKRVSENPAFHVIGYAAPGMGQYLPLNTQLWPLDDLVVRKALMFGVDRRTVTVRANGGTAATNISNLLVPGTIGRNPEASKLYSYDVGKANKLLDDGGYDKKNDDGYRLAPDGRVLEIVYPDRGDPVVELFKLDVEKNLSIKVATPKMDGATFRSAQQDGKYHTVWIGVGGPTGDVMYDRFQTSHYGAPGRAYSFFEYDGVPATKSPDAKIDKLLDGARAAFDVAEQQKIWEEAELYLMENAVAVPLVHDYLPWLTNPARVGGELFLGIDYLPNYAQWYSTQE